MTNIQTENIKIIRSAISGEKFNIDSDFSLEGAIPLIKSHRIESMVYYGAVNCGISQNLPAMQKLFMTVLRNVSISENQTHELERLYGIFEENDIDYLPVKGSIVKFMYPKNDMRFMGDADILIRPQQYEKTKQIMRNNGYREGPQSFYDFVWDNPGIHIELHKNLFDETNKDMFAYFGTGWERAKRVNGGKSRFELSLEDHFIYLFCHFTKHYRCGGIGIKHIVDLWVYKQKNPNMDFDYIEGELKRLGFYEFYLNIFETLRVWFDDKPGNEKTDFITDEIFSNGAFGFKSNILLSDAIKNSGNGESLKNVKRSKKFELIFLPYKNMCLVYPILKKLPFLLPFMWVIRGIRAVLFRKNKITDSFNEVETLNSEDIEKRRLALSYVGLKFD